MRCFTEICGEIRSLVYDNFKSDNGENIIHTKNRIRIPIDYVEPLESVCLRGGEVNVSSQLLRKLADILNLVRAAIMEKDLKQSFTLRTAAEDVVLKTHK